MNLHRVSAKDKKNQRWCSFCSDPPQALCDDEECDMCFENSFASHPRAERWSYELNDGVRPRDVFKNTKNKYFFDCDICLHSFDCALGNVNTGHWCRFCEHQELCDNDCDFCFENSFANSPKAKHWGDNDGIQPRDVFISCGKKYNFDCDVCSIHQICVLTISLLDIGVLIVLILHKNYVRITIVNGVLKNHSPVTQWQSIGVQRIKKSLETFLSRP